MINTISGVAVLDSDVKTYITTSSATDTTVLNNLAKYLKSQSLWTSCRIFPFKSAQNKGSGTTVYGLGGWTSNDITLVNGPTWGSTGVTFDATNDRGTVTMTGISGLSTLYVFDVQIPPSASSPDTARIGQISVRNSANQLIIPLAGSSTFTAGETIITNVSASSSDHRRLGAAPSWSAGARKQFVVCMAQTGSAFWVSKDTASTTGMTYGTQDFRPSQAGMSLNTLDINATTTGGGVYSGFVATTRVSLLLCKTVLTQEQRERITDYLDAL